MSDKAITFWGSVFISLYTMNYQGFFAHDISFVSRAVMFFVFLSFWFGGVTLVGGAWDLGKAFSKMIWSKFS